MTRFHAVHELSGTFQTLFRWLLRWTKGRLVPCLPEDHAALFHDRPHHQTKDIIVSQTRTPIPSPRPAHTQPFSNTPHSRHATAATPTPRDPKLRAPPPVRLIGAPPPGSPPTHQSASLCGMNSAVAHCARPGPQLLAPGCLSRAASSRACATAALRPSRAAVSSSNASQRVQPAARQLLQSHRRQLRVLAQTAATQSAPG